jgi:hypothetical protein
MPASTPQPGPGNAPFDPMADSPFTKWLLYGTNTPILDFFTNDSHLRAAQDFALGISVGAATIATGGMLLEAAPTILGAGAASAPSLSATATAFGTAAAGVVATNPALPEEIEEGVEEALPALENTASALADELPPTGPSFEGVIDPSEFENDPQIIDRLSRARELDIGGYQSLTGRGEFGRVGDNLDSDEALQNAFIRLAKGVERVSDVTRNNPAIALRPELHRLIQNLQTSQMQGLSPNDVLQYHLDQMKGFVPDYVLQILERESQSYIQRTF